MNPSNVEKRLASILEQIRTQSGSRTGRAEIDPAADFAAVGINSVDLMEFVLRIENEFGVDLLGSLNPDDLPGTIHNWAELVQRRLDRSSSAT